MGFNQMEFMKQVREDRAMWEALKRRLNRRVAEARNDPKMQEEHRGYCEMFLREGGASMEKGIRILEKGYHDGS